MVTMKVSILLLLVILESNKISGSKEEACHGELGMSSGAIKDEQISASVFHGIFKPEQARFHGNSAWCVSAENGTGAFLQVDLGEIKRVTWLGIQGFADGYVSNFTIEYKRRETDKHWRNLVERLPYNTSDIVVFQGNRDNSSRKFRKFKGSRVLRYLRIVLREGVGERWCLKLEVYGCQWKNKEGLVSYQTTQGRIRGFNETAVTMNDATYDGTLEHYGRRNGALYGGLGQLTDGDVGGDEFWLDIGNGKSFEWVGWYDMIDLKPSVLFEFDEPRRFHKIFFHCNNRPGNVRLFRNLLVAFSTDGLYFSRKFVFHPSSHMAKHKNQSMWIEVDLQGHVGKYLNCEFTYEGKWILLSEVEFESEGFKDNGGTPDYTTPTIESFETRETTPSNNPSLPPIERQLINTKQVLSLHAIIAMAAVGTALLLFTVVFIIWLTRIHQEEGEDGSYPIRNVNRVVNSLRRSLPRKEQPPKYYSSSSESDEDIEDLMERKINNAESSTQPWNKSLDKHKMNNMIMTSNTKTWFNENKIENKEKNLDGLQLKV